MSGGHFNYDQSKIGYIADEIETLIQNNGSQETDQYGYLVHQSYPDDIIAEFKTAVIKLREAAVYAQRIDWLVSGDDGEECFRSRLKSDLARLGGEG
jgi:hypothetical protein